MSKFHLTRTQRAAFLVGAALVAVLLILQIATLGMEHTPWMAGAIVVVVLAVVGLSPDQPPAAGANGPVPAPVVQPAPVAALRQPLPATSSQAELPVPLTPVRKRAAEVHKFEPALDAMTNGFSEFIVATLPHPVVEDRGVHHRQLAAAIKVSFMVLALTIERNRHGFLDTEGFQALKDIFIKRLAARLEEADAEYHDASETRRRAIADLVIAECAACERTIHESIANYAECSHFPLDPVVARVNREVPLASGAHNNPFATTPEQRDGVYHPALKVLHDTATAAMFGAAAG